MVKCLQQSEKSFFYFSHFFTSVTWVTFTIVLFFTITQVLICSTLNKSDPDCLTAEQNDTEQAIID